MANQIGDKVIHSAYGMGEIIDIEDKTIGEKRTTCYVMRTPDLTVWIPVDNEGKQNLRTPTPAPEFSKVFKVLQEPGERLLDDRVQRKNQLMAQMSAGSLLSICEVVRDLTWYKQEKKLNDHEKAILDRATKSLLTEWAYSLQISISQAQEAMTGLLTVPQQP